MFDRLPFVRYVLALTAGILLSRFTEPAGHTLYLSGLILFFVCLGAGFVRYGSRNAFVRLLLIPGTMYLGLVTGQMAQKSFSDRLESIRVTYEYYGARVRTLPEDRGKSVRVEVSVHALYTKDSVVNVASRALLYFPAQSKDIPAPGDIVWVKGRLVRPQAAETPYTFDYRRYLERKGVPWVGYVRPSGYRIIRKDPAPDPSLWPFLISESADRVFRTYVDDDEAYGLIKAMLLGRRDDIHAALNDAYIASGTVHILSVSGLHVGVFFVSLNFLLGFLKKRRYGKYIYLLILTVLMGFYAVMTGLPPSVLRAAIMCVMWAIADSFSRRQEPVNTLSMAAFVILLFDPGALFDIGFQLSFLAMLGIFLWSRPIQALYTPPAGWGRHLWQLAAMSVAAQLITFPVSIFYFHQFPAYFLPVNLLVIDISGYMLPAAFLLVFTGFLNWPWLSGIIGGLVNILAIVTNRIVLFSGELPGHLIENLYLDGWEVFFLLLLSGLALGVVWYRQRVWLYAVLSVSILFMCYSCFSSWMIFCEKTIGRHTFSNGNIYSVKVRNSTYIVKSQFFELDTLMYERHFKDYLAYTGSDTIMHTASGR